MVFVQWWKGRSFYIGGPAMLRRLAIEPPANHSRPPIERRHAARRAMYCSHRHVRLPPLPSPMPYATESREAIQRLHEQRIEVVMLTGDAKAVAKAVAADWASTPCSPRCCPKTRRQDQGTQDGGQTRRDGWGRRERCARAADCRRRRSRSGRAPMSPWKLATSFSCAVTQRTCRGSSPSAAPPIGRCSRTSGGPRDTTSFAIPLAAGVLAAKGILLPPAFAAVLMSASTVIVAINAQLLRRAKL